MMEANDEALKKTLVEGKHKMHCPSCNALNTLSPVGKASFAIFRGWKCEARVGEFGYRKACAQVVVFEGALGAGNPKVSTYKASTNVTSLLNELERELQNELKPEKGLKY